MQLRPKIAPYIVEIISQLQNAGYEAYIVGGAVRDFLLNRQPKDYDLSTSATPEQIKKVFRDRHVLIIGKRFRLVHLHHHGEIIEISTFRKRPQDQTELRRPGKQAPEHMIFQDNDSALRKKTHGGAISPSTRFSMIRSTTKSWTTPGWA